jgi:hypothetical protein
MKGRKATIVAATLNVALGRTQEAGVADGCEYVRKVSYVGFEVTLEVDGAPAEKPLTVLAVQVDGRYYLIAALDVPRRELSATEQAEVDRAVATMEEANRKYLEARADAQRAGFEQAPGSGGAPIPEEVGWELFAALRAGDLARAGELLLSAEALARAFDCPGGELQARLDEQRRRLEQLGAGLGGEIEATGSHGITALTAGQELAGGCTAKLPLETAHVRLTTTGDRALLLDVVNVAGRWYAYDLR